MTFEEHKEFPVNSSSLKEVRSFAREVLAKDPLASCTMGAELGGKPFKTRMPRWS